MNKQFAGWMLVLTLGVVAWARPLRSAPAAAVPATFVVTGWNRPNVNRSTIAQPMPREGGKLPGAPWVAPWGGYVTGLSYATQRSVAVRGLYRVEVYINGAPTGIAAAGVGTDRAWNGDPGNRAEFHAGDSVELRDAANGQLNRAAVQAQWFGAWAE